MREALDICARFRCKAFASIVDKNSPDPGKGHLRKDYNYLLERFFYFLQDTDIRHSGIVVFDELEKTQSHILVHEMENYFKRAAKGRQYASQIIPEPFFVHSDLTTGIQLADFVAYIISWGLRLEGMNEPARLELGGLADQVSYLRYRTTREGRSSSYVSWSFKFIRDLRSQIELEEE